VNGRPGPRAVEERLPGLREELELDFVSRTARNAATARDHPKLADRCSLGST
jgi:calcineurin-like phosphoesterase